MIGREISGFRVISRLAEGGMGVVYQGEHLQTKLPVAIKFLRKEFYEKRDNVGRFIREAVIYKRLRHPNLIKFYSFGFDGEEGFFQITELLDGIELEEELMGLGLAHPMKVERACDIALQISAGLEAAHDVAIVHRDLKPANIFLIPQSNTSELVKIFDFGIGKLIEEDFEYIEHLTVTGEALGTPLYMAPEQIRGDHDIGVGVDIYALGVILFQLLTGHLPYTGYTIKDIFLGHIRGKIPHIGKYERSFAHSDLEQLVYDLMQKEPSDRPSSIVKVKERLWSIWQTLKSQTESNTLFDLPSFDSGSFQELLSHEKETFEHSEDSAIEKPAAVLLLQTSDGEKEIAWLLLGERVSIGSGIEANIRMKEYHLASKHAEFYCAPQGWITVNNLDDSIVRVNGAVVSSMMLSDDDWITLGNAEIRLHSFSS